MYKNISKIAITLSLLVTHSIAAINIKGTPSWVMDPNKTELINAVGFGKNEQIAYMKAVCEISKQLGTSMKADKAIIKMSSSSNIGKNTQVVYKSITNSTTKDSQYICVIGTKFDNELMILKSKIATVKSSTNEYYEVPSNFKKFKMALSEDGLFMIHRYKSKDGVYVGVSLSKNISDKAKPLQTR